MPHLTPVDRTQAITRMNSNSSDAFNFWAALIVHQYKTCPRDDTPFWRDHRDVQFNCYSQIMDNLNHVSMGQGSPTNSFQVDFASRHPFAETEGRPYGHFVIRWLQPSATPQLPSVRVVNLAALRA